MVKKDRRGMKDDGTGPFILVLFSSLGWGWAKGDVEGESGTDGTGERERERKEL